MGKQTWTEHELTNNMLKQLAAAAGRIDLNLHPGRGHGAAAGRFALDNRGLTMTDLEGKHCVNLAGLNALDAARKEGW